MALRLEPLADSSLIAVRHGLRGGRRAERALTIERNNGFEPSTTV
jgi:hypothetical protein